jgi:cell division inhibitor SepF
MSFIDKFCGKLGLIDSVDKEVETQEQTGESTEEQTAANEFKSKKTSSYAQNNVVNFHATSSTNNTNVVARQMNVIVIEPLSFDDAQQVADYLKNKKPVVVNFENTDSEVAKRIIDFISGTTYALSGDIKKVGNNVFLCAPSNVDVTYTQQENKASDTDMPWLKK